MKYEIDEVWNRWSMKSMKYEIDEVWHQSQISL